MTSGSTALLPTIAAVISLFSKRTFAATDYIRIPDVSGGLIIQWGAVTLASGQATITFPIAFPTYNLHQWCGDTSSISWSSSNFTIFGPASGTKTGMVIRAVTLSGTTFVMGTTAGQWLAIGY